MDLKYKWIILSIILFLTACDTIVLKRINISNLAQYKTQDLKLDVINWAKEKNLKCEETPNCLDCSNRKKRVVFIEKQGRSFLAYGLAAPIWIGDEVNSDLTDLEVIVSSNIGTEVVFYNNRLPPLGICTN